MSTKTASLTENKTKPVVCLTQTHHHRQDCHLHADSKHLHHLLRQDKTESLHSNKQDIVIEIGLWLMLEELGTTH